MPTGMLSNRRTQVADFALHPRLACDCMVIGEFPLSLLLLMNDSHYPWFILVPKRRDVSEVHQLTEADQQQLMRESSALSEALTSAFQADKINIAALGNIVSQLHIHHIARFKHDPAWPAPVWGKLPVEAYKPAELAKTTKTIRAALAGQDVVLID